MSSPGAVQSVPPRRQKRMGPAPFASFEDLSDELESPEDKNDTGSVVRLPGIREDVTPNTPAAQDQTTPEFIYTGISLIGASSTPPSTAMSSISTPLSSARASLQTPSTPRIDISRASSSSHHEDSRDSTPERELFEGHDPARAKLGLGFREEGTLDLRSSTEELDFQDPQVKLKPKTRSQSPLHQDDCLHRKDSQSSEVGLLSISGRTSRLSSIGSQGSAQSRISNASHLSVISGQSGLSRSPSPHKMVLETSFCGTKPNDSAQKTSEKQGTKAEPEDLEMILLSRKHDPTKAILAEGITVDVKNETPKLMKTPPEKPNRKESPKYVKTNITITVDKPPVSSNNSPKLPKTIISTSGVEYTYIPLKGPLPVDTTSQPLKSQANEMKKSIPIKNAAPHSKSAQAKPKEMNDIKQSREKTEEPKYIRIKLKPDHMYDNKGTNSEIHKPDSLDLNDTSKKTVQSFKDIIQKDTKCEQMYTNIKNTDYHGRNVSTTPSASPKLSRHVGLKEPITSSKSPSPSLSRKSSFASLFRNKEAVSPDSPTVSGTRRKSTLSGILKDASENLLERRRSRSKSRDRDKGNLSVAPSSTESIDSKGRQKTVFSIFKTKRGSEKSKSEVDSSSSEVLSNLEGLEFKFNSENNLPKTRKSRQAKHYHETPLDGDSIRIPLHSPTYYEQRSLLQELKSSSQGSQETVIEAASYREAEISGEEKKNECVKNVLEKCKSEGIRQNSISSENIVFSTRLGSNNEIFTTKLPKEKNAEKIPNQVDISKNDVILKTSPLLESNSKTEFSKISNGKETLDIATFDNISNTEMDVCLISESTVSESTKPNKLNNDTKKCETEKRNATIDSVHDDENNSSESERDSEIDFLKEKKKLELKLDEKIDVLEIERKGLVLQQDSFEDELPYIPTTLPLERSVAVPIVPVKQRGTYEMKTCPIERPRSTTPINPSCLEDYCEEIIGSINTGNVTKTIEKIKISLPKDDSMKSPRRTGNTNWFEFAEKRIATQRRSSLSQETETAPPPLPPRGVQKEWINFEEIPERRKPPKRIQTIPSRGTIEVPDSVLQDNVVYSYVNPEDCKCECHEINARERDKQSQRQVEVVQEDELPLLEDEVVEEEKVVGGNIETIKLDVTILDRRSIISDSSLDLSTSVEHVEANGIECLQTPFTSDLGVSSNRSSIVSQDESHSPVGSPNAFPKTS